MLYLSGAVKEAYSAAGLGFMRQPGMGNRPVAGATWAADNGCFAQGDRFDAEAWLRWLEAQPREGCLFAVAPDVVGDAFGSWERSKPYLATLRAMGFPVAFVAQDGFDDLLASGLIDWDAFDVLFIGGSTAWKLGGAQNAVRAAKAHGKRVHMGRVNSAKRIALAESWGVDTADGTYLAFTGESGLDTVLSWLRTPGQLALDVVAA